MSSVKILASASWSCSTIAEVISFTILALGWSLIAPPLVRVVLTWRPYEERGCAHIGRIDDLAKRRTEEFYRCRSPRRFHASPDAPTAGGFVRSSQRDRQKRSADMNQYESTVLDDPVAQELSERLADVFRTADVSDVLADDVFLDGHPPLWRFQLQGRDALDSWIKSFMPDGADTTVIRTIP